MTGHGGQRRGREKGKEDWDCEPYLGLWVRKPLDQTEQRNETGNGKLVPFEHVVLHDNLIELQI